MSLRVEHKLIRVIRLDLPLRILSVDDVTVLHDLREEEALLVVSVTAASSIIHVVDS